ncbi:MAG: CBS domain-containing protein, partial [Halanaerobium sp. MSAO_Bac5]
DRIAIMKDGEIVQTGNHEEILTNAENDYVAEFVQDVNRSRVLTAEDIMDKPKAVLYNQDGLRTALHKMRNNELGSIFVLGEKKKYRGIVKLEDVVEYINKDKEDIEEIIQDVPIAEPDEKVDQLFAKIADINTPLPVLDEENKLEGIIVKTSVLANLASENV